MKRWQVLTIVSVVVALTLGIVGFAFALAPGTGSVELAAAAVSPAPGQGVMGNITSIQDNVVTLQTAKGEVKVTVNDATVYRMPPKGVVTLADVQKAVQDAAASGAKVRAIVLTVKNEDVLTAKTVAILPPMPAVTHFVGKVMAIQGNTVTATNAAGETMTVTLPDVTNVKIGQEIVLGVGPAGVMQKGVQGLKLGMKQEARLYQNFVQRFKNQLQAHKQAVIGGAIQSVDTQAKTVTVVARTGKTATLNVTADTKLMRDGTSATIDQLQAGDRVTAAYNPQSSNAIRIVAGSAVPATPAAPQDKTA